MDRTIKVTSDRETEAIKKLNEIGRKKENKALSDFHIHSCLYSEIFFVPSLDTKNMILGQFNTDGKTIVLNEILLDENVSEYEIKNVFLHELAHALDFAINKATSGHSKEFREYCEYLGVDKSFEKAKIKSSLIKTNKTRETVKKLLALSSSPFENEAAIAIKKAQEMMIDLNKEQKNEDKLYYVALASSKRFSLYYIKLTSFVSKATGVFMIKCKGNDTQEMRAYGTLEQVEFALYLYTYLDESIEKELKQSRRDGAKISRDSFALGAFPELEKKLFTLDKNAENALVAINHENEEKARAIVFKRGIRHVSYSARSVSSESVSKGANFGKTLNLPDKIKKKALK